MVTCFFISFLRVLLLAFGVQSCLFTQGIGDQLNTTLMAHKGKLFKREVYYKNDNSPACECAVGNRYFYLGKRDLPSGNVSWNHCRATPVASNLLITTHRCLMVTNGKIPLYENWDAIHALRRTYATKDLRLWSDIPLQQLTIRHIEYHPQFIKSAFDQFDVPDNDLVIIVTMENIFDLGLSTLCLPEREIDPTVAFYTNGEYIGSGGILPTDETVEARLVLKTPIMKAEDCVKEGNLNVTYTGNTLCVRFRNPAPTVVGGSLAVHQHGINSPRFMVGLANVINLEIPNTTISFAFFTNILPHVAYIEDMAAKYDSKWCASPEFEPPEQLSEDERFLERYDWEPPTKIPPRDESLDCVCGLRSEANQFWINAPPIPPIPPKRKSRNANPRISGGESALILEFPWMIQIEIMPRPEADSFSGSICGASIINDRVILTAAHCVVPHDVLMPPERFRVWAQFHQVWGRIPLFPDRIPSLNPPPPIPPPPEWYLLRYSPWYYVEKVIVHPDYFLSRPSTTESDIALMILKEPLKFESSRSSKTQATRGVHRPICLPEQGKPLDAVGMTAVLPGFGTTKIGENKPPDTMKKGKYPVRNLEECANFTKGFVTRNMICATSYSVLDSSLVGDSGGPLSVTLDKDGLFTQIGMTSFGDEPMADNHPGIQIVYYTNIQRFLPFIDYYSASVGAKWCRHHEL